MVRAILSGNLESNYYWKNSQCSDGNLSFTKYLRLKEHPRKLCVICYLILHLMKFEQPLKLSVNSTVIEWLTSNC